MIDNKDLNDMDLQNKFFFLAETMIETMEQLEGTRFYKQKVKNLLKAADKELRKEYTKFYLQCQSIGKLDEHMSGVDVYNATSDAYEYMFDFFERMKPHEVVSVVEILKTADELQNVKIAYKPAEI